MLRGLGGNPACLNPSNFPPPSCSGSQRNVKTERLLLSLLKTNEKIYPPGSIVKDCSRQLQSLRRGTYVPGSHREGTAPRLPPSQEGTSSSKGIRSPPSQASSLAHHGPPGTRSGHQERTAASPAHFTETTVPNSLLLLKPTL